MSLVHLSITENKKAGFTLMELLVVVAIIAILFIAVAMVAQTSIKRARVAKAQADLNRIAKAVRQYELDTESSYIKTSLNECKNESYSPIDDKIPLVADDSQQGWNGPYIDELPLDPWGSPYFYMDYYYCGEGVVGCEGYEGKYLRVVASHGPDKQGFQGTQLGLAEPYSGTLDKDNIVLRLFTCP